MGLLVLLATDGTPLRATDGTYLIITPAETRFAGRIQDANSTLLQSVEPIGE